MPFVLLRFDLQWGGGVFTWVSIWYMHAVSTQCNETPLAHFWSGGGGWALTRRLPPCPWRVHCEGEHGTGWASTRPGSTTCMRWTSLQRRKQQPPPYPSHMVGEGAGAVALDSVHWTTGWGQVEVEGSDWKPLRVRLSIRKS